MKIIETKTLIDGQRIHVLGYVQTERLFKVMNDELDMVDRWGMSLENRAHFAIRHMLRKGKDIDSQELNEWQAQNEAKLFFWVDPRIFQPKERFVKHVNWGVGFRPRDPLDIVFTLRWG